MQARVWGCRGSLAAPGPETLRYGGNTSCVEVRLDDGSTLVLDAGTGMRPLGVAIDRQPVDELHVLLTHLHLDHLQGLGFFRPLFRPGVDVHIWGPASPVQSLADRIAIYLSPPLFPVRLADIPARVTFHDASDDAVSIGPASVRAGKVTHQGPTVGYRIEEGGRTLVYLPDHEPLPGGHVSHEPAEWMSGHDIAHDADVLFHDAQYLDDEYPQHIGWGHSSIEHVMGLATSAGVRTVVLFHHDPYHVDDELEALLGEARKRWDGPDEDVRLAHEGMTIELDGEGVRFRGWGR
ncbi:MAG TPA: MBL fold metallo-hydrolase [Acidimicrobiia bacterium]|nr:MBL fold metallo-hydrolase [Acidimicrobiia bacterium]